jgi:hypothetical protein
MTDYSRKYIMMSFVACAFILLLSDYRRMLHGTFSMHGAHAKCIHIFCWKVTDCVGQLGVDKRMDDNNIYLQKQGMKILTWTPLI